MSRIVKRDMSRSEADLQSDIRSLLLFGRFNLGDHQVERVNLESQLGDGTRRRIDIEVGSLVIEVKKNLTTASVLTDAVEQLKGYVQTRSRATGTRFSGVLTDGRTWLLLNLAGNHLTEVAKLELDEHEPDSDHLQLWLDTIIGTGDVIEPTPDTIVQRLGSSSPSYALDKATLKELYGSLEADPEVKLKRELWAKLLRTAFGSAFTDSEDLFVDHTLLVLSAEIVAHATLGFNLLDPALSAASIARGDAFANSQIYGIVEADFFDWVLQSNEGHRFVTRLKNRLAQFRWHNVDHDVLKLLYESIIGAEVRRHLGEYYTPDWLAQKIVDSHYGDPLNQRLFDPSCGSGTFVFHAVRKFVRAARESGLSDGEILLDVTSRIVGIDVHPVAVTLARVTYLLALGSELLESNDRPEMTVPIYLGDSLQWDQRVDVLGSDNITVTTAGADLAEAGGAALFGDDLIFPRSVLADARVFDFLVTEMADRAEQHVSGAKYPSFEPLARKYGITSTDGSILEQTFHTWCRLHAEGRDHIWGYYIRNLIRPLWLAEPENRFDVLTGNPPWLRYNNMTTAMQERFKRLGRGRGLLEGRLGVAARDLSSLFVVRAVELYLKDSGHFGFVMPLAALSRRPYEGFRSGKWESTSAGNLRVTFDTPWDLDAIEPDIFPVPACVVGGEVTLGRAGPMPGTVAKWSGRLPRLNIDWAGAAPHLSSKESNTPQRALLAAADSPYKRRFRDGAILYPRVLVLAEEAPSEPFGASRGRVQVRSRRSNQEKPPWKGLESLAASVERQFFFSTHFGETIAPFRPLTPLHTVIPLRQNELMTLAQVEEYPGLRQWWLEAEAKWRENRVKSETLPLVERIDFHRQLSSQRPAATNRVVYSKAGNSLAACRLDDPSIVIDHKLYWAATATRDEARYLVGILNSATLLRRVAPLQSRGLFGPRDFDKNVFEVPIPEFSPTTDAHTAIAEKVLEAEQLAAQVDVEECHDFKVARRKIRTVLADGGILTALESLVNEVVPEV